MRHLLIHIMRLALLVSPVFGIIAIAKAFKKFIFELIDHIKGTDRNTPPWEQ